MILSAVKAKEVGRVHLCLTRGAKLRGFHRHVFVAVTRSGGRKEHPGTLGSDAPEMRYIDTHFPDSSKPSEIHILSRLLRRASLRSREDVDKSESPP